MPDKAIRWHKLDMPENSNPPLEAWSGQVQLCDGVLHVVLYHMPHIHPAYFTGRFMYLHHGNKFPPLEGPVELDFERLETEYCLRQQNPEIETSLHYVAQSMVPKALYEQKRVEPTNFAENMMKADILMELVRDN